MTTDDRRERMVNLIRSFAVMYSHKEAMDAVREFEREYAHELAEMVRAERDAGNLPGSPLTPDMVRGMTYAAELITAWRDSQ